MFWVVRIHESGAFGFCLASWVLYEFSRLSSSHTGHCQFHKEFRIRLMPFSELLFCGVRALRGLVARSKLPVGF